MSRHGSAPVRVLVVDDQTLFRLGMARLLDADSRLEVVGQAADGIEAFERCGELSPDVVLLDLKMPRMDGVEFTRRLTSTSRVKVLVLTVLDTDPDVLSALRAGASGYVLKDSEPRAIASAIIAVDLGEHVLASRVAKRIVGRMALPSGADKPRGCDGLTPREVEILQMIAIGAGNKEIARRLAISDKTVRNHLGHMYDKLSVSDRSQVMLYAVRRGLVKV